MLESLQVHVRIASAASTAELKMQRMLGASPRAAVDACYAVLDEILEISHRPMPADVRPPADRFVTGRRA